MDFEEEYNGEWNLEWLSPTLLMDNLGDFTSQLTNDEVVVSQGEELGVEILREEQVKPRLFVEGR